MSWYAHEYTSSQGPWIGKCFTQAAALRKGYYADLFFSIAILNFTLTSMCTGRSVSWMKLENVTLHSPIPTSWDMLALGSVEGKYTRTSKIQSNSTIWPRSRNCIGQHFANQSLFIAIATMLWSLDIKPAVDAMGKLIIPSKSEWHDEGLVMWVLCHHLCPMNH